MLRELLEDVVHERELGRVERAIREDDELSDEEDPRFLKQDDAEVIAAARQAPYFKRFDAFVDWIGEGAAR